MMRPVRAAYDANAARYAELFSNELGQDTQSKRWLGAFAEIAIDRRGPIVDLGCGPGSAVRHLSELGLEVIGLDLSPGQIAQARRAFPGLTFELGDLTALPFAAGSLGGIVSRHSLIHLAPSRLDEVFLEWNRVLEPGAPLSISFFGSRSSECHGSPFDHRVVTAYELFPATVGRQLQDAGFTAIEAEAIPIPEGGRPFGQTTILARTPDC